MTPHHHHAPGSGPVAPRTKILIGLTVLVLLLAAVFAGLWINNTPTATDAEDALRSVERLKNLAELQAADQATLTTYGWNDRAKGIVRIPIDRAMELVLPALNGGADKAAPAVSRIPQQQP